MSELRPDTTIAKLLIPLFFTSVTAKSIVGILKTGNMTLETDGVTGKNLVPRPAAGIPALAAQAIGAGAFGGGRQGVQQAEFASNQARNRAALQAQLLGQGFAQAQNLAAADFGRNLTLDIVSSKVFFEIPSLIA